MEFYRDGYPRVVVTGIGAMTPLGQTDEFWESLKAGRSGIRLIEGIETDHIETKIAGQVKFEPTDYIPKKEARRMARVSQLAIIASRLAKVDSGLNDEYLEAHTEDIGVVLGTGQGGHEPSAWAVLSFYNDKKKPSPFDLVSSLTNMPGHHVSVEVRAMGPLKVITAACASGTQALGEGLQMIRNGQASVVFAGGAEATIWDYILAGFIATRAISTDNSRQPETVSRPFDANRTGFVMSEGAAFFTLETLEHAHARGARIYAELVGHGHSSDAAHMTAPEAEGRGARIAMQKALKDGHVNLEEIGYINAHGTATKANDVTETFAIKQVFGETAYQIPVSSTKSMIGHSLGAAGAMEAIACIKTLQEGVIHPTINYETPDPDCDLDYVPNVARDADVHYVLSNSFGFGGQNSCMIFGKV